MLTRQLARQASRTTQSPFSRFYATAQKVQPSSLAGPSSEKTIASEAKNHRREPVVVNGKSYKRPAQDPYHLSLTATEIASKGDLAKAIQMVKDASLDSQSTVVWNTLMKQALLAEKYKLSFELFIDMKRRGFKPNLRTYNTLLAGYARIDSRSLTTLQFERAQTVFGEYRQYSDALRQQDPTSLELGNQPVNDYITILEHMGEYQTIFDVFYGMPKDGPLAADQYTFTAIINAIGKRKALHPIEKGQTAPEVALADVHARNASDVRFLWRQLVTASERLKFPIDSHVITASIFALSRGNPSDQLAAFSIIHDYLGLHKPGDSPVPAKVNLTPQLISSVFALCNTVRKYRLTLHYAQVIMDSPSVKLLTSKHMNEVLTAYASLSSVGPNNEAGQALETIEWMLRQEIHHGPSRAGLRPTLESYNLALTACWRGVDWGVASRLVKMMSGLDVDELALQPSARGSVTWGKKGKGREESQQRSASRIILPDAESMSILARTALSTRDIKNVYQALRIASHFGDKHFFIPLTSPTSSPSKSTSSPASPSLSRNASKASAFHQTKLGVALQDLVSTALRGIPIPGKAKSPIPPTPDYDPEELTSWRDLTAKARNVVKGFEGGLSGKGGEKQALRFKRGVRTMTQRKPLEVSPPVQGVVARS